LKSLKSKTYNMRLEGVSMNKLYAGVLAVILIVVIVGAAWFAFFYTPAAPASNKIGLILGTGGLGDKSFNDIAYAGALRAKDELGIEFSIAEPKAISEYEGFQTNFAKTGEYALVICIGFDQVDALNKTAQAYPNQNFALVDMVLDMPNVASLTFRANEGSFLTGVIAGMFTGITENNKVGFVGGQDIDLIRDFYVGYKAGVEWANPSATVLDPVFVGGWGDPTKGKELAESLIELGADGIFAAAGKSGLGTLEAVHENGIMGFGVDSCQDYLYPEIVASATKRVDVAVYKMIEDAINGEFEGGFYSGGLAEKWTGCSRLPDEESFWEDTFDFTEGDLPEDVVTKLTEANAGIIAGTITVPSGYT
jgi:basic membrane protein A